MKNATEWPALERQGRLSTGDIILSSDPATWLARAIAIFQSIILRRPVIYTHAQRYIGAGMIISQDWTHKIKSIAGLAGQRVSIWHNTTYTEEQRRRLVEESRQYLGSRYDWLGIVGQAGTALIAFVLIAVAVMAWWAGDHLGAAAWLGLAAVMWSGGRYFVRRVIQIPWRTFCSERVALTEQTVDPGFVDGRTQVSPAEINRWLQGRQEWLRTTIDPKG